MDKKKNGVSKKSTPKKTWKQWYTETDFNSRGWRITFGLLKFLSFVAIIVIIVVIVEAYFYHRKLYPKTQDAHLKAQYVQVSTLVSGTVNAIYVQQNQIVEKNQLLFTLTAKPYLLESEVAKSNIDALHKARSAAFKSIEAAQAEVNNATLERDLIKTKTRSILSLVKSGDLAPIKGNEAITQLSAAENNLVAAQNRLEEAKIQMGFSDDQTPEVMAAKANYNLALFRLNHTHYYAPISGIVSNFSLTVGNNVGEGQPLFVIINPNDYWVEANFDEKQLVRIKVGQTVKIWVDIYPNHAFNGVITSIDFNSGNTFSLLPPQNASGNWVPIQQRFPTKIKFLDLDPEKYPIRLGASCTVIVNTTKTVGLSHEKQ